MSKEQSSKDQPPRLTDAEWKVMREVWRLGDATTRDVHQAVEAETGWAYTTVKTLLTRMTAKGAVVERRIGSQAQSSYAPGLTVEEAQRDAFRGFIDRVFAGSTAPLLRFLAEDARFSAKDRARLQEMLTERERRRRT